MAHQEKKQNDADPEQCWTDLTKRKGPSINYFILDLNGDDICVISQGVASGIEDVMSETKAGTLVYLRVDQHEQGAYDNAVIKPKFVRIQVNSNGINAQKLIQCNKHSNSYNMKKAAAFTKMVKLAYAQSEIDLKYIVDEGKFSKSAHAKNSTYKFGEGTYNPDADSDEESD